MKLFDCHTHLSEYSYADLHDILTRAEESGVSGALLAGTTIESTERCIELSKSDTRLFAGVGIHPSDIKEPMTSAIYDTLMLLAKQPTVIAMSEIGLDGIEGAPCREIQEEYLIAQIGIAKRMKLPIIYHSRMTYPDILNILENEQAGEFGGAAHYFQGDIATAKKCIELGFDISLARPLLRIPELQEVVGYIPMKHLVLETDSYPQTFKKHRTSWTEPRHVKEVAEAVATIKGITLEEVTEQTGQNLLRMLGQHATKVKQLLGANQTRFGD